jgi:hypothetical protein
MRSALTIPSLRRLQIYERDRPPEETLLTAAAISTLRNALEITSRYAALLERML